MVFFTSGQDSDCFVQMSMLIFHHWCPLTVCVCVLQFCWYFFIYKCWLIYFFIFIFLSFFVFFQWFEVTAFSTLKVKQPDLNFFLCQFYFIQKGTTQCEKIFIFSSFCFCTSLKIPGGSLGRDRRGSQACSFFKFCCMWKRGKNIWCCFVFFVNFFFFDNLKKIKNTFFNTCNEKSKVRAATTCRSNHVTARHHMVNAAQDWIPVFPVSFEKLMPI